jgi:predicted nicotinamide N-methyase
VLTDRAAFLRANLTLGPVPLTPELQLYQADEPIGLWELTEGTFGEATGAAADEPAVRYRSDQPPPFWAFAWAGGQALARYLLDHPETVRGRRVLDLASGSGLVAIAAARAGAARVRAVDIDPLALAAVEVNAQANDVSVLGLLADVLDTDAAGIDGPADVVTAGDVFYSKAMADRVLRFLRRAARGGAEVFVGDPARAFFPSGVFEPVGAYDVPVTHALESTTVKATRVYRLPAG